MTVKQEAPDVDNFSALKHATGLWNDHMEVYPN